VVAHGGGKTHGAVFVSGGKCTLQQLQSSAAISHTQKKTYDSLYVLAVLPHHILPRNNLFVCVCMCGILGSKKKGAVQIERRNMNSWVPYPTKRGAGPSKGPSTKNGNVVPSGRKGGGRGVILIQWFHGTARA
jgi:hypothetical protein